MQERAGTLNPYTPNSGVRPPELAGREVERERLQSIVTQLAAGGTEKHMIITGLRGVGKTVLLIDFEEMCQQAGWYAETKEIGTDTAIATLIGNATRKALLHMSGKAKVQQKLKAALSALKAFEVSIGGFSFKLEVDAAVGVADSGDLAEDLRDLLVTVGEAAVEAGVGFALILDELHNASALEMEALIMALHRANQKRLPIAFVGAGLPLLPRITGESKTYAERMFFWPRIGALSPEDARDALTVPSIRQGVKWDQDAIDHVLAYSEGYPYFLQEFGRQAWLQIHDARITAADAIAAEPVVEAALDEDFFEVRIGRLSDAERAYVVALAYLGDGPQRSGAVAEQLGSSLQAVSRIRDQLRQAAVIYGPERGLIDFTVPHCAAYLRRRYDPPS